MKKCVGRIMVGLFIFVGLLMGTRNVNAQQQNLFFYTEGIGLYNRWSGELRVAKMIPQESRCSFLNEKGKWKLSVTETVKLGKNGLIKSLLQSYKYPEEESSKTTYTYAFDDQKRVIKTTIKRTDSYGDRWRSVEKYAYDKKGRIKKITYSGSAEGVFSIVKKYDKKNRISSDEYKCDVVDSEFPDIIRTQYSYTQKGMMKQIKTMIYYDGRHYGENEDRLAVVQTINCNKKTISIRVFDAGIFRKTKINGTVQYNSQGKITSVSLKEDDSSDAEYKSDFKAGYKYYKNDYLKEVVYSSDDGGIQEKRVYKSFKKIKEIPAFLVYNVMLT